MTAETGADNAFDPGAGARSEPPSEPLIWSARPGLDPPAWLRLVAFVAASGVLALGSTGLLLAVNRWYRPGLAFALGGVVWMGLIALARPAFAPLRRHRAASGTKAARIADVYAAVGVVAIVAITVWNMANTSQHVLVDRDGGAYTNTGRWIARDGSLEVKPRVGPFANAPSVGFDSLAIFQMSDGSLQFQFAHLLPVLLAESYAVGSNFGLFHVAALLGGLALLSFFVLAWRLFRRPLFALSAMLALAFTIPEVSFSRDNYSEIPSQVLLFTALWLLVSPRVLPRWRLALTAALFLGALEATRIDAIVFLIGVPVVCVVAWLRADPADRRSVTRPSIVAFLLGIVPGLVLGLVDLMHHSGQYWNFTAKDVHKLAWLTVASALACAVVACAWRFVLQAIARLPWTRLATAAGGLVGLVGFGAWAFRPKLQQFHAADGAIVGLQQTEHVVVDSTKMYWEWSLTWTAWYLGPITLALGMVALALVVRAVLLGRMTRIVGALVLILPGSLLYLYQASAVPDHVWVTRRFLLGAYPLFILLALGLASVMASVRSSSPGAVGARVVAVVVAIAAVAYPIHTLLPVRAMAEETGYLGVITDMCHDLGPHAVVVVLESARTDGADDWIPQALRGWCGADVGVTRGGAKVDDLHRLANAWRAAGRPFFVASSSYGYVKALLPDAVIKSTRRAVDSTLLAPTLTHRPNAYRSQSLQMVVSLVPPG